MRTHRPDPGRVLALAAILPVLALASYPEDPDDPMATQAAAAAVAALDTRRGALVLVAAPPQALRANVVDIVGVQSSLKADITPLERAVEALGAQVSDTLIEVSLASDVLFDFDSDQLKAAAEDSLNELKTLISESEVLEVTITGHTDAKGGNDYNMDLSLRRAASVSPKWTTSPAPSTMLLWTHQASATATGIAAVADRRT